VKWLSKFFGSTPSPPQGFSITSLKLAAPWGREVERSERRVVWLDSSGIPLSVDLVNGSLGLPVPTDKRAVCHYCREIAEGKIRRALADLQSSIRLDLSELPSSRS
jgi:hypothetical protein